MKLLTFAPYFLVICAGLFLGCLIAPHFLAICAGLFLGCLIAAIIASLMGTPTPLLNRPTIPRRFRAWLHAQLHMESTCDNCGCSQVHHLKHGLLRRRTGMCINCMLPASSATDVIRHGPLPNCLFFKRHKFHFKVNLW